MSATPITKKNTAGAEEKLWTWVHFSLTLPILVAFGVWFCVYLAGFENSFAHNFGSGDLFSIIAMMLLLLSQEINLLPQRKVTGLLAHMKSLSLVFLVIGWVLFGFFRGMFYLYYPTMADKGLAMLEGVSYISSALLLGIASLCLLARLRMSK
ncbi:MULTISPECIES: hypothetical protein [unclassified Delftia]|uniref:hypothetical protein n=1 Tax=unclassified Delftia TaxID=2613839 RepID=UPI0018FF7DE9|nr:MULTISPECIES: hypothetical protein [unclassified Delftia]MBK0115639.1 hypothetical protein [Delftia sp. S65]MBK0119504.1 hypothetical protein [Delftia sp. S67]MBK0130192.1 hypothetical protein [Delftia sp. S66]